MVISRTPLRVSFTGGGSDVLSFSREHGGAVVSTAIDKYVYVLVTERFDETIRVSYSKTEIVPTIDELQHELAREALRVAGLRRRVEIVTVADVPSEGSGLGASSAFTVGLVNALFAHQGILKSPLELAEEAARIEIDVLGRPIGKQDQYAAAFGGLAFLEFGPGTATRRAPLVLTDGQRAALDRNLIMVYTGRRSSSHTLDQLDEVADRPDIVATLGALRDDAVALRAALAGDGDADVLGEHIARSWELKRRLPDVTTPEIDDIIERAVGAGALGAKLLGSGNGGFLLLYVRPERQPAVRGQLAGLRELPFSLESEGSRIIHVGR